MSGRRMIITVDVPPYENVPDVMMQLSLSRDTGELATIKADDGIEFDLLIVEVEHNCTVLPRAER